eukprot:201183_1
MTTNNNQTMVVTREKTKRGTNEVVTEEYKFQLTVNSGRTTLSVQKDTQGSKRITKESQLNALILDPLLLNVASLLGFSNDIIDKNKRKKQLIELIAGALGIQTKKALEICAQDEKGLIEHQTTMHVNMQIQFIVDYISEYQTNMYLIGEVIPLAQQKCDILSYVKLLWMAMIDNFSVNNNNDQKYRKYHRDFCKTDHGLIDSKGNLKEDIRDVLNMFNDTKQTNIASNTFWYSINIIVWKYFNNELKQYGLSKLDAAFGPMTGVESAVTDARKCAIFKFFGSAMNSLWNIYSGSNYSEEKSMHLHKIMGECLLSYDLKKTDGNNNDYDKVPLRIRLANRGNLRIINIAFYNDVAKNMYAIITHNVRRIFHYYDRKQIKKLENNLIENDGLYKAFDRLIGDLKLSNEQTLKRKVYGDVIHTVITRYVLSMSEQNKAKSMHVGVLRIGIKKVCT